MIHIIYLFGTFKKNKVVIEKKETIIVTVTFVA